MQLDERQVMELAKPFAKMTDTLTEFYNNPENMKKYREWYLRKYGVELDEV